MGMLMHHTWQEMQKQETKEQKHKPESVEEKDVPDEEPVKEPVKRGRRKTTSK